MPARNVLKSYLENGFYHVYNRGVEKRIIFSDRQDESVFLSYLKEYLTPKDVSTLTKIIVDPQSSPGQKSEASKSLRINNFYQEINLLAYCLMPNHFHLLIKQNGERSIEKLMRSLSTRYVQYFNRSHERRVGGLFQDAYKAVLVESEDQLLHLSRYIHRNPLLKGVSLQESLRPSSYRNYLGLVKQEWVSTGNILIFFAKSGFSSYQSFVEGNEYEEKSLEKISAQLLDMETL
ncbi:transposase [Candidatus Amesbacteria bacterium]|nr:transposase [Candidatus Amesbacteria bacterium]